MRTEKELIEKIRNTSADYCGVTVTEEELDIVQNSDMVDTCEYVGLRDGAGGPKTFHVALIDDDRLKSLYLEE